MTETMRLSDGNFLPLGLDLPLSIHLPNLKNVVLLRMRKSPVFQRMVEIVTSGSDSAGRESQILAIRVQKT